MSLIFPALGPQIQICYIANIAPTVMLYMGPVNQTNKLKSSTESENDQSNFLSPPFP